VTAENPHAGGNAVVLDIGGDVGALIVTMPAEMIDLEVEIIPAGTGRSHTHGNGGHNHPQDHSHPHEHDGHSHSAGAPPHVAVVPRPAPDGSVVPSLVFGELVEGSYDLYVRPDGPVRLTAEVHGGEVTQASWPAE